MLGTWAEPASGALNWREVFDDLAARGVERIRFVVTAERDAVPAAYPHVTVLSSVAPLLRLPPELALSGALSRRSLRLVLSIARIVQQLQAQLTRVVRRYGCFADRQAAVSFESRSLCAHFAINPRCLPAPSSRAGAHLWGLDEMPTSSAPSRRCRSTGRPQAPPTPALNASP